MTLNSPSNTQQLVLENTTNSESLLQQKPNQEEPGQTSTKLCRICGIEKPLNFFRLANVRDARTEWRRSECIECQNNIHRVRDKLRRDPSTPPKPPDGTPCKLCRNPNRKLVFDHCHYSERFRGYICQKCNHGLGSFETIEALEQAIEYLSPYETIN